MRGGWRARRWVQRLYAIVSLVVLVAAAGVPTADALRRTAAIHYELYPMTNPLNMCVGGIDSVRVFVKRIVVVDGRRHEELITGAWVRATSFDPDVAVFDLTGTASETEPVMPNSDDGIDSATFNVMARAVGHAQLLFTVAHSGEEQALGSWPAITAGVDVNVWECYVAKTSGLATEFSEDDMGDLREPFYLTGLTPDVNGVKTDTQFMYFEPNIDDRLHGHYSYIDAATIMRNGAGGSCEAVFNGDYKVTFDGPTDHPVEGNLEMSGLGYYDCGAYTVPINYGSATGFEVLFKPATAP